MVIKCNVEIVSFKFGQKVAITLGVTNIVWQRVRKRKVLTLLTISCFKKHVSVALEPEKVSLCEIVTYDSGLLRKSVLTYAVSSSSDVGGITGMVN